MNRSKIIVGKPLPNIPWEKRPKGSGDVVWRYSGNPVIPRDIVPCANSVFNSAVVPFGKGYAGVFRVDDRTRSMRIHAGRSKDGIRFEIDPDPIRWICDDPEIGRFVEAYDPRVVEIEGRYLVTWCNNYHGYTIGMGHTEDFEKFYQMENSFLPFNRNGVLFPRKIKGDYVMLSRPSDTGHTPFGDIFVSHSPDLVHWGRHRHVMAPRKDRANWQSTKIGAGPVPIETTEGWLLFYHGVLTSCNGFVYHMGAALLDLEQPWKVRYRTGPYLLNPRMLYECVGDVPNVVFPCAALSDPPTGRIAIYYGAADTVTGLALAQVDELIEFIKNNSEH
ncbi:MAG TPA: glycoside hydrolase family 130 protein [Candidatus Paceibacterota bacterium]|nr:glycoside hydrolase family 130 protein [Candidatus Paceibacterota bacterium]